MKKMRLSVINITPPCSTFAIWIGMDLICPAVGSRSIPVLCDPAMSLSTLKGVDDIGASRGLSGYWQRSSDWSGGSVVVRGIQGSTKLHRLRRGLVNSRSCQAISYLPTEGHHAASVEEPSGRRVAANNAIRHCLERMS